MDGSGKDSKGVVNQLFEFGKKLDKLSILAGIGAIAIGATIAAPAIVAFGAVTVGGTIGMKPVGESIQDAWNKRRARSRSVGSAATRSTSA